MKNEVSFKDILDHINSAAEEGRANCTIGLFVRECFEDKEEDIDNFIVKKPLVKISSFAENNELFYNISFIFKSYNDADYKQMWRYVCKFVDKANAERKRLIEGEKLEKVSALSMSIIPEKYAGKYFAYVDMPFYETISCAENAFDRSAVISFDCEEKCFGIMYSDDDMIDRRSIEREIERELEAEEQELEPEAQSLD